MSQPPGADTLLALTLTAGSKTVAITTNTIGISPHGTERGVEQRCPSTANDGRRWAWMAEHHETAVSLDDLRHFVRGGGHALVSVGLVERWWPAFLDASPCTRYHSFMPFIDLNNPPPEAQERFARGSLRQRVFARDEDRCCVCGRSPDDALDVKLDLHHIAPHADGGMTIEDNLVTLCQICHEGADEPDANRAGDLYEKVASRASDAHRDRHALGVSLYRKRVASLLPAVPTRPLSAAVIPLLWDDKPPPYGRRFIYKLLCGNALVRHYPLGQWKKIVCRAFT